MPGPLAAQYGLARQGTATGGKQFAAAACGSQGLNVHALDPGGGRRKEHVKMAIPSETTNSDDNAIDDSQPSQSDTRLYIGGVPKNVTNEMIVARFAAVPKITVKEVPDSIFVHN
jgi:hypothetical protein